MNKLSIYIHWPFCKSKCPYCDFNSHELKKIDHHSYTNAFLQEIEFNRKLIENKRIDSIFFGGGTPSLMKTETVYKILNRINSISLINKDAEITLEVNPNAIDRKKFIDFRAVGINRVSIGVQSFKDNNLKFLGRTHSSKDVFEAINLAKKLFKNYSFDLMYCLPNQSPNEWEKELLEAVQYISHHISCYQLTIEKGTQFYNKYRSKCFILPEDDTSTSMYNLTCDLLNSHGINQYEISNFAKSGYECRHNLCYWNMQDYIGIGPGAHGRYKLDGNIWSTINFYNPDKWIEYLRSDKKPVQLHRKLSSKDSYLDTLSMGLRLNRGIEASFIQNFSSLQKLTSLGFLRVGKGFVSCTSKGRVVLNYLIRELL